MVFELVTTRNCNLNCKYCFEVKKNHEFMNESMIPNIISFIEEYKKRKLVSDSRHIQVDFNGGETLLNKNFIIKFIELTKNMNYSYTITTNGILIDDDIIDLINDNDIFLQISLDGIKDCHDENRIFHDNRGSFDIVYSQLKRLQEKCDRTCFNIASVITPNTVKHLYNNTLFFLENGFTNIALIPCSDYTWEDNEYKEFQQQMKMIGKLFIKRMESNTPFDFSLISQHIKNALSGFSKPHCDAILGEITILPNGEILPCSGFVGCKNEKEFHIGSIYEGIDEMKLETFLNKHKLLNNRQCEKCVLFDRCQNDCLALNNRINNNILIPDDTSCNINSILIKEVDNILAHFISTDNKLFKELNKV